MSKNLTFKLIMDGDSKGLVAAAKQSEAVTKKVFDSIKAEADQLKQASTDTAKTLGSIVPEKSKELADGLTKSLSGATQIIRDAGDNAKSAASNFTDFGNKSVKALAFLKSDLEKAKSRLEAFSKTKATPADIEIAQKQVDQLEKEVQQAESAFIDFHTEVGKANNSLKHTDTAAQTAQKGLNGAKFAVNALAGAMAALGVGVGIRELAQTADTYTNLSARINIATSEGGNFQQAMAGVHQIALATNSSLDATANLFAKINDTGKEMGMTQQQALDLTKTINQAIKIGGGSAQASEAAVQQFIQALQSGVLRGDEFNSIMEQAPGLTSAMAKGLGVATGELRKMAENGELGAERVVKALQSQASEVQKTYDKFPLTISNALQKIATSWQILIGEMDQSNGASATVANALSIIADNLGILKVFFDDVANGIGWFQDKLSEIDPSTLESIRSTLSAVYDTIKTVISSIAGIAETAWSAFTSTLDAIAPLFNAILNGKEEVSGITTLFNVFKIALGVVSDAATGLNIALKLLLAGVQFITGGIFALNSAVLDFLGFDDLAAQAQNASDALFRQAEKNASEANRLALESNSATREAIKDITQTEEDANKERLANFKKTLEELQAQEEKHKSDYRAISDERIKLNQQLEDARKSGNQSTIDAAVAGLAELDSKEKAYQAESKKITDEKIKAAQDWVNAQLVAADGTQKVADAATQKTMQTTLAAQGLKLEFDSAGKVIVKTMTDAVISTEAQVNATDKARKAATALGIDLDIALGRVSEKFAADQVHLNNYANGFDELGLKGEQATNALYTGWEKWVATAKSQVELDAAKAKLQSFGDQGKLSTSQVEMGLQAIKRASQELPAALSPAEAAMERLGIKSKEQLKLAAENALTDLDTVMKSGEATQEGLQKAYEETVRLAQASGNAQVMAAANAKAAYLGLEVQLDATGKATVSKLGEIQQAAIETQRTVSQVSQSTAREEPEISAEQQATNDHWDDFKAKMKARTDELNAKSQARSSGGGNASLLSNSGDSAQQISAVPDAPLIATSLDIQPMEGMETKQSVEIKIDMGTGQTATVSAAPDQATALEEMMRELEAIKGRS